MTAVLEDPGAAHQIRIRSRFKSGYGRCTEIVVTCTCLAPRTGPGSGRARPAQGIIEARQGTFPAGEAVAAYRDWHAARGIEMGT